MPAWYKLTLVAIGLLVAAGVVIMFLQFRNFRHFPSDMKQTTAEGSSFGKDKDYNDCVDEALTRITTRCSRFDQACQVKMQMFLMSCLENATEPTGYCAAIPRHHAYSLTDRWAVDECARRGHARDQRCTLIMATLQIHCTQRTQ